MNDRRRVLLRSMLAGGAILCLHPLQGLAQSLCTVQHPLRPANKSYLGECHNCGMKQAMWARTWHSYEMAGQVWEVCSLHCLAEATANAGVTPANVQAALYMDPDRSIAAEEAYYVVGSTAAGTMTMTSKLAFAEKEAAEAMVAACGGRVERFAAVYGLAGQTVAAENRKIASNRLAKGKIVEPVDNRDRCPVCDMFPARYPKNKCQLQTTSGEVIHFCSTYCLFQFLRSPGQYGQGGIAVASVWVVDAAGGQWLFAKNAYYVVGTAIPGPMGREAWPFVNRAQAMEFAATNRGSVLRYDAVSIEQIVR